MKVSPIILFAYKRPQHIRATLEALHENTLALQSKLYIYIDGLKDNASDGDIKLHQQVINIAKSTNWCLETEVIVSNHNKGLAESVVEGVSSILKKHKRVIVLEDDLVTSPYFLEYMNKSLDKYEYSEKVACISGYTYPLKKTMDSAYFIKGADCWGWATWEEKWNCIFKNEPNYLLEQLTKQNKINEFNFNNSYPYSNMLQERIEGKNQSWAVLWYASSFLQNKLCLYPSHSLVNNIGNDGSGTHSDTFTNQFDSMTIKTKMPVLPNVIEENAVARKEFELFFRTLSGSKEQSLFIRFKNKIKTLLGL